MNKIVGGAVSIFIVAITLPMAIGQLISGSTYLTDNSVDTSIVTMFGTLLPIIIVISIIMLFVGGGGYAYYKKRGGRRRR